MLGEIHSEKLGKSKNGLKFFPGFINALAVSGFRFVSRKLIFSDFDG
ncbi:hypothetical protein XCR_2035 [Xanthomonas campestris pv. raphani 756C]|nr:hypothetical protein XCR_2035 [Xanthomonas campestris pv. raphani 756C]